MIFVRVYQYNLSYRIGWVGVGFIFVVVWIAWDFISLFLKLHSLIEWYVIKKIYTNWKFFVAMEEKR